MHGRPVSSLFLCLALAMAGVAPNVLSSDDASEGRQSSAKPPSFVEDIRPLFQAKCWRCHNAKARKADLDLTTVAGILKGGESGPAIVPRKPNESLLYEKVHGGAMPPGKKDRLSELEVATIRCWIEAGAESDARVAEKTAPAVTQHDVVPIMLRRCNSCHGLRRQEAGLDLRTKTSMLRGGKSGPAIVPGKPDESLVIKRLSSGQMPPRNRLVEASVKLIEPTEIAVLVRWIAAGAPEVAQ